MTDVNRLDITITAIIPIPIDEGDFHPLVEQVLEIGNICQYGITCDSEEDIDNVLISHGEVQRHAKSFLDPALVEECQTVFFRDHNRKKMCYIKSASLDEC